MAEWRFSIDDNMIFPTDERWKNTGAVDPYSNVPSINRHITIDNPGEGEVTQVYLSRLPEKETTVSSPEHTIAFDQINNDDYVYSLRFHGTIGYGSTQTKYKYQFRRMIQRAGGSGLVIKYTPYRDIPYNFAINAFCRNPLRGISINVPRVSDSFTTYIGPDQQPYTVESVGPETTWRPGPLSNFNSSMVGAIVPYIRYTDTSDEYMYKYGNPIPLSGGTFDLTVIVDGDQIGDDAAVASFGVRYGNSVYDETHLGGLWVDRDLSGAFREGTSSTVRDENQMMLAFLLASLRNTVTEDSTFEWSRVSDDVDSHSLAEVTLSNTNLESIDGHLVEILGDLQASENKVSSDVNSVRQTVQSTNDMVGNVSRRLLDVEESLKRIEGDPNAVRRIDKTLTSVSARQKIE